MQARNQTATAEPIVPRLTWRGREKLAGFTRIDLFVVLVVLAMLVVMLLPALARTKTDSRVFQCLNNVRELTRAWRMYCDDSQDRLPYAGALLSQPATAQYAWVNGYLDNNPSNWDNWDTQQITNSPLWRYCGKDASIWRCPADPSYVVVNGVAKPRVRSVAMNVYLGGWGGTDGGWGWANSWKFFAKTTEFTRLPAAKLFVLQDLREDQISDGIFATKMDGYSETTPNGALYGFYQVPGARHDGGTTFSFADGRSEIHHWRDLRTTPPIATSGQVDQGYASPRNPDIAWLQDHSTRPK